MCQSDDPATHHRVPLTLEAFEAALDYPPRPFPTVKMVPADVLPPSPESREYFLLTFTLMFTILIVLFIAWRAKRVLSFLAASITTAILCAVVPLLFMSYVSCRTTKVYEDCITFLNGQVHLRVLSIIFLPICLLLRLMVVKWQLYLTTFTLLGSPWIALYGLAQFFEIILHLEDVDQSSAIFQTLQLYMYFYIMITFSGIWIFLFSVNVFISKQFWKVTKLREYLLQDGTALLCEDLEKAQLPEPEDNVASSLEPDLATLRSERKTLTKSHTTTRLVKFSHQWSIDEFIRCDHRADAPKYIDSVQFASPDNEAMRFFLRLYPRGKLAIANRAGESAVSLYLHYIPAPDIKTVTIGFVCSIIDKGGAKCDLHERRDAFSAEADAHGWENFIYRSTLLNSRYLLPQEKLTIHCEVSYAVEELVTFETIV